MILFTSISIFTLYLFICYAICGRIYITNNFLILVFGDTYYIDIIRNLYENVIRKYNIKQFAVATVSLNAFHKFKALSIPVFFSKYNITDYVEFTNIHSKSFVKKMHIRTYILLHYISIGQSLLHIDADTYYFTNPLHMYNMKKETDIVFACDNPECDTYNTGYMYKF